MREGKKRKSGEKHGVVVPFIYLCIHWWDGIHNLGVSRRSSNQLSYMARAQCSFMEQSTVAAASRQGNSSFLRVGS